MTSVKKDLIIKKESELSEVQQQIKALKEKELLLTEQEKEREEKAIREDRIRKLNNKIEALETLQDEIKYFIDNKPYNQNMTFLEQANHFYERYKKFQKHQFDRESSAGITAGRKIVQEGLNLGKTTLLKLGNM